MLTFYFFNKIHQKQSEISILSFSCETVIHCLFLHHLYLNNTRTQRERHSVSYWILVAVYGLVLEF